jgi:hypothetical protein
MESANINERKLVMQAFIAGITVRPDAARLDLLVKPLPVIGAADSTVRLVAGARFVPAQVELPDGSRIVARGEPEVDVPGCQIYFLRPISPARNDSTTQLLPERQPPMHSRAGRFTTSTTKY